LKVSRTSFIFKLKKKKKEKLTSLKILRGEKNQIKEFPNFLSKLFKLQEIYLDGKKNLIQFISKGKVNKII